MDKIITIFNITLIITMLSACSEKTHTVEWYLEHKDKLAEEFKKCKDKTLEELAKDKHCVVIRKAQDEVFHEHQRDAPIPTFK